MRPLGQWNLHDLSRFTLTPDEYQRLGKLRDDIALAIHELRGDALVALRLTIDEAEETMKMLYGSVDKVIAEASRGEPS